MTPRQTELHRTDIVSAQQRRDDWTRPIVEVAALLIVPGAAPLFAAGTQNYELACYVLIAVGGLLIAGAVARRWTYRQASPQPVADTPERPLEAHVPERIEFEDVRDRTRNLWRLRASVTDTPGRLAQVAACLAGLGGNIRTVHVHPVAGGAVDEVLLHVPTRVTARELIRAVTEAGGHDVSATRADVRELDDLPTRTLTLATDLVNGRSELARVLDGVLGDVTIHWQEEPDAPLQIDELADDTMCLEAPGGGVLVLTRPGRTFTPAEFARARAMAQLGTNCRARLRDQVQHVRLASGIDLDVRPADRDDLSLVAEFHERCSTATRYRRYFGAAPGAGQNGLLRLLTPALGRSFLVLTSSGEAVAMGNLMYDGDTGELALLVRDDWQRKGVGSVLARKLVEEADLLGLRTLNAHTHVDNTAIARTLRGAGLKLVGVPEPGEWCWTRHLRPAPAPAMG